jgi:hypothetical protein
MKSIIQRFSRSFTTTTSTVPTIQIKIHHKESTTSENDAINFQIIPHWSESYELISVEGGKTTVNSTGDSYRSM